MTQSNHLCWVQNSSLLGKLHVLTHIFPEPVPGDRQDLQEAGTHCVNIVQGKGSAILLLALQMFLCMRMKQLGVNNLWQGAVQCVEPIKKTVHGWLWVPCCPIPTESG